MTKTSATLPIFLGKALGVLFIAVAAFASVYAQARMPDVRPLPIDSPTTRETKIGDSHFYLVELKKGNVLQVQVREKAANIILLIVDTGKLRGSAETKLLGASDLGRGFGRESVTYISEEDSVFLVNATIDQGETGGKYVLTAQVRQRATDVDHRRVTAEKLDVEGAQAANLQKAESAGVAAEKFRESILLWQKLGDQIGEAQTRVALGAVYDLLDESARAKEQFALALALFQAENDKSGEALTLLRLGKATDQTGDREKAFELYRKALPLLEAVGDRNSAAINLLNTGRILDDAGEKGEALRLFNRALTIFRATESRYDQAVALQNIGSSYSSLGIGGKALDFFAQSLKIFQTLKDRAGEATTLTLMGETHAKLGEYEKTADYYEKALLIFVEIGNRRGVAGVAVNLGQILILMGEKQKAVESFEMAIELNRDINDKRGEAVALNSLGILHTETGEPQKGFEIGAAALSLARVAGDKQGEAMGLGNLMFAQQHLKNQQAAIFFGKQAVNKVQEIRRSIKNLDREFDEGLVKSFENFYRRLSDLLIAEGRFTEARQVLAMLKEQEFTEFIRRDAEEIKKFALRTDLRTNERRALEKYDAIANRITALGAEFERLEAEKNRLPAGEIFAKQAGYDELAGQIKTANAAFRLFLDKELAGELGIAVKKEIEQDRALQGKLKEWGAGTVALSTVVGEDRYRVILTTPTVQVDGKTEIKSADLNKKIFAFREALQNPQIDPRPLGKELYDIVVKPIEKDLLAAGAKTLLWSLDGTLRYLPLGALWNGNEYLAQKLQNVNLTSTTRQNLSEPVNKNWQVLGLGVTAGSEVSDPNGTDKINFSPLPGVRRELIEIVRDENSKTPETGLLKGVRLLDADFSEIRLKENLGRTEASGRKFSIIHFATHFRLGDDASNSFLLLGNNQVLSLEQVSDTPELNFTNVEIVTLSACNTAFGNGETGREIDSLATFIELRGAKAVIATLWSVADESTQILMSEFYRLHKENPNLTKAEAMQKAQVAMIAGKMKASGTTAGCRSDVINLGGTPTPQAKYKCDAAAPFAHPFYWSPFVLIGNWR